MAGEKIHRGGDSFCGQDRAVEEAQWRDLPPEERKDLLLLQMAGDPTSWAAPGSSRGALYLYPRFEYAPLQPDQPPNYEGQRQSCLELYRRLPAGLVHFGAETNPVLDQQCRTQCPYFQTCTGGSADGRRPVCWYDHTAGFCGVFDLDREDPGRPGQGLLVRDLRLFGRPLTVKLWGESLRRGGVQKGLREATEPCPGARDSKVRYTLRLGKAIDRALVHNLPVRYIAQAGAVPPDTIRLWEKTRILEASRALPQLVTRYTLEDCGSFSTQTEKRSFLVPDQHRQNRRERYTLAFRAEENQPPRLISIYPATEWALIRKLASTALTQLMDRHRLWISPGRLFNLAIDYLSAAVYSGPGAPRQVSPVFGAMLFLSLWEDADPGCGYELFHRLDEPYSRGYCGCYQALLGLYERGQWDPWSDLPELLPVLTREEQWADPQTELADGIRRWCRDCTERVAEEGVSLVLCRPTGESLWAAPQLPLPTRLTDSSTAGSMRELITRLLLFNPATLSTVRTGPGGGPEARTQLLENGETCHYGCHFRADGNLDYSDVIPGIRADELRDLLEQGFLSTRQEGYLLRRPTAERP